MLWNQRRQRLFGRRLLAIALIASMVLNTSPAIAAPGRSNIARAPERPANTQPARPDAENAATRPDVVAAPLAPLEVTASTPAPRTTVRANANANSLVDLPSAGSRLAISALPVAVTTPTPPVADGPDRFYDVPASLVPPGQDQLLLRDQPVRRPPGLLSIMPAASVPLSTGWNLVSIPEELADTDPAAVLGSIYGSYSQVYAYDACDSADPWKLYDPASSTNDLTSIDPSKGFWIEMTAPGVLIVDGTLPVNPSIQLCAGWNLVGYPRDTPLPVRGALAAIAGKYTTVFVYDPAVPLDPWLGYLETAPSYANDLALMEPGKGYWIYATQATTLTFVEPGAAPTVAISAPTEGSEVTAPSTITGTVTGADLDRWALDYRSADSSEWIELASGATAVTDAALAEFDPTLLLNGIYRLRLTATNIFGQSASTELDILVAGQMKIGVFTLSFVDLAIPVSGIPIEIVRTYDSRDKRQHDFGVGWTLDIRRGSYTNNRKPGDGWRIESTGGLFPVPCAITNETKYHVTEIRFSDVEFYRFALRIAMNGFGSAIGGGCQGTAYFEQIGGIPGANLDIIGDDTVFWRNAGDQAYELDGITVFEPKRIGLTTRNRRMFEFERQVGLTKIEDANGNTLTINENGVTHSSGRGIVFSRDVQNRIVAITDPMENTIRYLYDSNGDLIRHTDQASNITGFVYDRHHYLQDIIDPRGITATRSDYDNAGRLLGITDAEGNRISLTHDIDLRQDVVEDRLGHVTIYEYDDRGNVTREINPLGFAVSYTYDDLDNVLSETDPLGNTTSYSYDVSGNLLSTTDSLGNTHTFTYANHQLLSTLSPAGELTSYTHDVAGNPQSLTDPMGNVTQIGYDINGNPAAIIDPLGNRISLDYDRYGNLTRATYPNGATTTYTYDANGNQLTETQHRTDQSGQTHTITGSSHYDRLGQLIAVVDALGNTTSYSYNEIGLQTSVSDPSGNSTVMDYDTLGRLYLTTFPDGSRVSSDYDANGNEIRSIDQSGRITSFEYDAAGQLLRTVLPDGSETRVEYDQAGRLTKSTDQNGNVTSLKFDGLGRVQTVVDALNNATSYVYGANGRVATITDANSHSTTFEYDANGLLLRNIYADGTYDSFEYDAAGRRTTAIDQAGVATHFVHDSMGQLVKVIDALGSEFNYSYDEVGNRISYTDASGRVTTWSYDDLGRVVEHTLPLGMKETLAYDASSRLVGKTDFNDNRIEYTYDTLDRMVSKTYPDGSEILFAYTPTGQTAVVTDTLGVSHYEYDVLDQLTLVQDPFGASIGYGYDPAGNRITLTVSSGVTAYTYDSLNRLASVTAPGVGTTTYEYDAVGKQKKVSYPNGTYAAYTYDSLDRLTKLENGRVSGGLISSYTYTLGPTGRRLSVLEDNGRRVNWEYDQLYRLTNETIFHPTLGTASTSYTYDVISNRLTKSDGQAVTNYIYDANDRLQQYGNTQLTYDDNGNTITQSGNGSPISYTYDFNNRLVKVERGTDTVVYDYDWSGTRLQSARNGSSTRFLVDKNRDYSQVLEEYDQSGQLSVSYVYGDDLILQRRGIRKTFYHYDGQGSTRVLTSDDSATSQSYEYDAFGTLYSLDTGIENRFLYAGEQFDSVSQLYYLRARYYDPAIGRFSSFDPFPGTPLQPQTLHKYLYGNADPMNNTDPSGLASLTEQSAVTNIIETIARAMAAVDRFRTVVDGVRVTIDLAQLVEHLGGTLAGDPSGVLQELIDKGTQRLSKDSPTFWRMGFTRTFWDDAFDSFTHGGTRALPVIIQIWSRNIAMALAGKQVRGSNEKPAFSIYLPAPPIKKVHIPWMAFNTGITIGNVPLKLLIGSSTKQAGRLTGVGILPTGKPKNQDQMFRMDYHRLHLDKSGGLACTQSICWSDETHRPNIFHYHVNYAPR